jgi:WD40 repeat protein
VKTPGGAQDADATRDGDEPHGPSDADARGLARPPPPSRLPAPLQIRDRERYDVLGEHGRGGLGVVARAYDKELGRQVAIKELLRRGDVGEVRFLREAQITARLEHPGIVPVHEAGRWPDGQPFYIMKLVSGRSLKELIEERRSVEERIALLHHVIAVADAMAYAHERKIIHRDLKPANVIAGDFGETIVIDWGLAKDLAAAGDEPAGDRAPYRSPVHAELTEDGSVLGTPMYMPPEQWRGEPVDQRADVFAIGAMLWELCSLQRVPPTDPRLRDRMLRRARIDQDLAAIIAKALAPEPAHRYRDAGELAGDLKAFKSGARITARAYSPFAVIAHWTRRHRALAATVAAAVGLAIAGSVLYVRDVAIERDKADAARAEAEAQGAIASAERDNARLSEATAYLDRDPTRARELLAALSLHTPRHALLQSRVRHRAAAHVIRLPAGISQLRRHPTTSEVAIVTRGGELSLVDLDRGELRVVDRDLQGAITWRADHWVYARRAFGAQTTTVTTTAGPQRAVDAGPVLTTPTLLSAAGRTYALDGGDLYALEDRGPALIQRGVRSIAGDEHLLLVCTTADELEVRRGGATLRRTRCARNTSAWPMVARGGDYAALVEPTTLLLARGGQTLQLPTRIEGEYELSMSESGLLAVADFNDKAWLVRPDGSSLEPGPVHSARPMSVATAGRIAAWGYTDGVVIATDTRTGMVWRFSGHSFPVGVVAVDEPRARVISAGGDELRVWPLTPSPIAPIVRLPGTVYGLAPSPDHGRALLDCDDGGVRLWSLGSDRLQEVHRHDDVSDGVAWLADTACSAGHDHRVICTDRGGTTREILSGSAGLGRLKASPDHRRIIIATDDGKVRAFDGALQLLFAHDARARELAFSPDGRWLASGAADGSVIVWDVSERRVQSRTKAHPGVVTTLGWRGGELWTASTDGSLKRWRNEAGAMALVDERRERGALWLLHLRADGWVAAVNSRELVVHRDSPAGTLRFDLDRHVNRIEVSGDGRYVAAATAGEIVVVDLARLAVASLPVATSSSLGYIGFVTPGSLVLSKTDGLFRISLAALEFVRFEPQRSSN